MSRWLSHVINPRSQSSGSVLRLTRRGRLAVMCQYQVNPVKVFVEGYQRAEFIECHLFMTALPVAIVREWGIIIFSHVFSTCSHPPQINFFPLLGAYQSTVIKDHRHCYELTSKANASHQLNNFRERWREQRDSCFDVVLAAQWVLSSHQSHVQGSKED